MNNFSIAQRPFGDIVLNRLRRCNKTSFDLAQYLCCEKQHLERALFGEVPLAEVCKLTDLEKYFGTSDGYFIQVFQNCANNAPETQRCRRCGRTALRGT
jgi:ribosomal protein L37E